MGGSKTKAILVFTLALAFGVLLFGGYLMNREKPPIPRVAVVASGESVFTEKDVVDGQNYFYSRGGQHMGSIWGHGAYLAPDWSADYLHRMGLFIAARHLGKAPEEAAVFTQAAGSSRQRTFADGGPDGRMRAVASRRLTHVRTQR